MDPNEPARLGVMGEEGSAVSARLRLGTREIASLLGGDLEKAIAPVLSTLGICVMHKSNFT
jgi:hypothetical protein